MVNLRAGATARIAPLLAAVAAACSQPPPGGEVGRGVLVIAIDALRADHVGCYGYDRPTTPALDALAAEGVRFRQAFAAAPSLTPSHVSLFTGCDPNVARRTHLVDELGAGPDERWRVPRGVPHLGVEMLVAGFATAAFLDHGLLSSSFGFAPGFQRYLVAEDDSAEPGLRTNTEHFLQWLRALDRSKPFLAYVHTHELERIWTAPDPRYEGTFTPRPELDSIPPVGNTDDVFFAIPRSRWRGGPRPLGAYEASYDGHLRRLDEELERLFAALRLLGRYEGTTVVVVGTYGVQFGESGLYLGAGRYSTADVGVPWIIRSPRIPEERRGGVVEGVASLIDVAPTVLDLARLDRPRGMHGVSHVAALLDAGAPPAREFAFATCGVQGGGAVFGERWTYEYTLVGAPSMRRSWFGDAEPHDAELTGPLFYDRQSTPYPPLFGPGETPPWDLGEALRAAGVHWEIAMQRTRRILQGGTLIFDPRSDRETVRELQERGFLGDDI